MIPSGRFRRVAVKIGSNVLTDPSGLLDGNRMDELVRQVSALCRAGIEVIMISSGAVASGRSVMQPKVKLDMVGQRQMWSSLGQVRLMQSYSNIFGKYQRICSQVLVTREDFRSRQHYLNIKNCFTVLLNNDIIPIVNENDVVAVTELMFTDNDELAGLVATMLNVDCLLLLTSVDGIFTRDDQGNTTLLEEVKPGDKTYEAHIFSDKSAFGRGGMLTKARMATHVSEAGIEVRIANGLRDNILVDLLSGQVPHTRFIASSGKSNIKKWLSHSKGFEKGAVVINQGALNALLSTRASSLLPVGVTKVEGTFQKGDIITIFDEERNQVGLGIAQYNDDQARQKAGAKNQRPLVHYDYLFLIHK